MNSTEKIQRSTLPEIKVIPVICSWCNTLCDLKKSEVSNGGKITASFGICPKCEKKVKKKICA
ncbi:MAG TPA: hypothetical protein DET40_06745 [Lentisphaeria bacterium]|nr:MAG: hypothetical protein A2X45_07555 [Lentisphaerae bacterium GWF2_50_93]HCE43227.1 hypothetical protein [Lentisphaeria bacterium]